MNAVSLGHRATKHVASKTAASLAACCIVVAATREEVDNATIATRRMMNERRRIAQCEPLDGNHHLPAASLQTPSPPPSSVSTYRKLLYKLNMYSLPIPRLLQPHDPDLTLAPRLVEQRSKDDAEIRNLQTLILHAIQSQNKEDMAKLLTRTYAILYGKPSKKDAALDSVCFNPQDRQNFLQQFGCTGWTEEALLTICELAKDRGIVEIGAGQGQWARALTERYASLTLATDNCNEQLQSNQHQQQQQQIDTLKEPSRSRNKKHFEFVLAFDDYSALPLNPDIYHSKTVAHHQYFYDKVQDCSKTSISTILRSWPCRGRVLLLVYPHQNDMAIDALKAYQQADPIRNDTIVYIGEGRGGVNANEAFFDALESGQWMLERIIPVRVFGTKGYERLYILRRRQPAH
ncbi:hypothetical protein MPSEU_000912400 [Mayamaea pseudoterrestris]|nr:hypothetical protein MPSEU_000912400 [Mayamaea pseudoterrestris]